MLLADFIFALFSAAVVSVVIAVFVGWRHPAYRGGGVAAALGFVFLTLFLAALLGGMWIRPFGPRMWGTSWLPYFAVSLIVASIILAAGAPVHRRPFDAREPGTAETLGIVFGGFFWLMLLGLVTALVLSAIF